MNFEKGTVPYVIFRRFYTYFFTFSIFLVQFQKNGGKCGVCGDSYDEAQPRTHEAGGEFGQGIITKEYIVGQVIDIEIDVTANHYGYFELKLCPTNNKNKAATQECLDKYPLFLASDPTSSRFYVPKDAKKKVYLEYQVLLPENVICSQCVVQWTYYTGNTWGICANGTQAIGCGDQEMFRNCADIKIRSQTGSLPPHFGQNPVSNPNAIYFRDKNAKNGRRALVVKSQVCIPRENFERTPALPKWCQENCLKYPPACNRAMCKCLGECKAIGDIAGEEGADVWCHRQCMTYPSKCPKDLCECSEETDLVEELHQATSNSTAEIEDIEKRN